MKEIEMYIQSNRELLQEKQEEYDKLLNEKHLSYYDSELVNLRLWIERYTYYIMGLKDAKKYIENEEIEVL